MKVFGIAVVFFAALTVAAPTAVDADSCYTYPNNSIGYYRDCGCTACGDWAITNCTECVNDDNTGACQTTSTSDECEPRILHPTS
jgi:hypothetical protein